MIDLIFFAWLGLYGLYKLNEIERTRTDKDE